MFIMQNVKIGVEENITNSSLEKNLFKSISFNHFAEKIIFICLLSYKIKYISVFRNTFSYLKSYSCLV